MTKGYLKSIFVGAVVALILAGTATATHIFTSTAEDAIETMLSSTSECCEFDGTTAGQSAIRADMKFVADNTYDIGKSGANRPRDLFVGRNTTITGTATLSSTLAVAGVSTLSADLLFSADNSHDIGASGATRPKDVYIAGNIILAGNLTHAGNLIVSSSGAHEIGASSNNARLTLGGAFTSDGAGSNFTGTAFLGALTAIAGDGVSGGNWISAVNMGNSIVTQSNTETIVNLAQLRVLAPTITLGSDAITESMTVWITGAPSLGTRKYALFVEAGDVRFGGELKWGDTAIATIDARISATQDIYFNIDADAGQSGRAFIWAHNNFGTSGTELLRLNDSATFLWGSDGGGDIGATGANRVNDIHMTGRLEHDRQSVTVDGATTFAITSDYVLLACTGAETIDTITGGLEGTRLIIEHTDTDCTINDDNDATASNAVDLIGSSNDVGAVAKFIMLVYNGSHWSQLAESDN